MDSEEEKVGTLYFTKIQVSFSLMNFARILSKMILGVCAIVIYIATFYYGYTFFYEYSYLWHTQIVIGAILIMLTGLGCVWLMFHIHHRVFKKKKPIIEEKKEIVSVPEEKKEIKNPRAVQNEKDKKIQKNYQKVLIEYKKNLPPTEYKKFQEETKYDVLLYDALMISRDKDAGLFKKVTQEKWELYAEALKKILD